MAAALGQPANDLEAVVTTDLGTFRFEFAPDKAPKHVEHFLTLARQGFYDGSAFHRVVSYGIIQGGDPLLKDAKTPRKLWGSGGLNQLAGEFSDLKHERGVVSTVSIPGKADSDGAQFFVCISPQPPLDGKFSAFGRVNEGMDVVEKISQSPAAADGFAEKPVRILKVTIEKKKVEPFASATLDELRRTVTVKTTLGTIKIKMEPDWAPNHVRNFLMLTATGWFNGTAFHRMVKEFVVQGGMGNTRPNGAAHPADRWVRTLKGEFSGEREARARHRLHGARRRSGFGQHVVLPDARPGAAPGRKILRVRQDRGGDGSARRVREGSSGWRKSQTPPGNRRGGNRSAIGVRRHCGNGATTRDHYRGWSRRVDGGIRVADSRRHSADRS